MASLGGRLSRFEQIFSKVRESIGTARAESASLVALNKHTTTVVDNSIADFIRAMENNAKKNTAALEDYNRRTLAMTEVHLKSIERLRLLAEERPQTTESAELALAKECCCHDAGTQLVMSAESSCAVERHRHEAAAQAAESAVLLLTEDRRRHEAPKLATPMRSLATSRVCADIKAIAYKAPTLPTTTSPAPPAMLSPSPRPTPSYLGAVLNTNGGGIRCRI